MNAEKSLKDVLAENQALRNCAMRYLSWLNVDDPRAGLEKDLNNPDMTADFGEKE